MDYLKVLKRAFEITWDYKALWIFGIILALTVGGSSGNNWGNQAQYTTSGEDTWDWETDIPKTIELPGGKEIHLPQTPEEVEAFKDTVITAGAIGLGVCCSLLLVWIVVTTVARYVAETALIRMVDEYEETGEKRSVREGFRLGWSRTSFRLFLIDLLIFVAGLILFAVPIVLLIGLIGLSVYAFEGLGIEVLGVLGAVAAVMLLFLVILLAFIVGVTIEFVKPFFQRKCVLEGLGVVDSLRHALNFVKQHLLWDIVLMWVIVVGLNIGWAIAMFFVGLALLLAAVALTAIPTLILGGLMGLIVSPIAGLITAILVGLLLFIALMFTATTFLEGLRMTFLSTIWTLTYRELCVLGELTEEEAEPWGQEESHELH